MPAEDKLRIRKCVWPVSEPLLIRFVIKNVQMNTKSTTQFHYFLKENVVNTFSKFGLQKGSDEQNQQSTCRDQWCESGMRQKDPNTPASYTWNQENHWKSYFFDSVFKWNCIWVTSEKFGSGWGSGLQSVLNRHPTEGLQEITKVYAGIS